MITKICLALLLIVVGANVDFSQAENKITPILDNNRDYLISVYKPEIEVENPFFLTYKEKQEIIYIVAKEEDVDFWELRRMSYK